MRLIWSSVAGVAVLLELTRGLLRVALLSLLCLHVSASWGGNDDETDTSVYGNSLARDWLYNSNAISLVLEGCMWGSVQDVDGAGCMEKNSQDGTTYWYQMANCRRPQAVFSIYASNSGSASCNKNNFKESVCKQWAVLVCAPVALRTRIKHQPNKLSAPHFVDHSS